MERAFFNAGAAPVARDCQTMCYYQSPNRLRSDSLPCEARCPGPGGIRFSPLGCPKVLCCVGAINRILPNYIIYMWMATRDNGLAATLYGPCTVSALAGDGLTVERKPMPVHWDWPLAAPVLLAAPAQAFDWKPTDAQALPDKPVAGTAAETIRLVPYGCTKFRISMFPVTERAWKGSCTSLGRPETR